MFRKKNKPDVEELEKEITDGLNIIFVSSMEEVIKEAFTGGQVCYKKMCHWNIVCGITSTLPDTELPEVAFAGKSNVGKSSLINALMNRKALARTSASPGKTQTINFYNINDAMYLVDLPGYGYAKVSQSVKEQWGKLIERYLQKSKQLKAVFLLIDIRHDPSANDKNDV